MDYVLRSLEQERQSVQCSMGLLLASAVSRTRSIVPLDPIPHAQYVLEDYWYIPVATYGLKVAGRSLGHQPRHGSREASRYCNVGTVNMRSRTLAHRNPAQVTTNLNSRVVFVRFEAHFDG